MTEQKFYEDVAVLRGLSIVLVVLYHLKIPFLNSGYLGVDIFFILSGFLMAALYADVLDHNGRLWHFYKKRIDRILPAYFVVLFLTTTLSAVFILPHELKDVLNHHLWSVFLMPNVGFWMESSYFQNDQFKPFLNFWSLGVELQFYAVFPLLVWFYNRLKWLPILFALGSFALCFYMADLSPKTGFFMMPCRIWQFLLGFYAARYLISKPQVKTRLTSSLSVLAFVGLIGLAIVPFSQDYHLQYGSTLISVFSVAVILLQLPDRLLQSWFGSFLKLMGKYSYSIYLVHFPVIAFFLYEPFGGMHLRPHAPFDIAFILLITGVLSVALFHAVETPFRKGFFGTFSRPAYAFAFGALLLLAFALPSLQAHRFSKEEMQVFHAWQDRATYRCGKLKRVTEPRGLSCSLNDLIEGEPTTLLVGNSHADSIKETLKSIAIEKRINLRMMKENCNLGKSTCSPTSLNQEIERHNIDMLIVHSSPKAVEAPAIQEFFHADKNTTKVVYVASVPIWDFHVPKAVYQSQNIWAEHQSQTLQDYQEAYGAIINAIQSIDDKRLGVIEIADMLCRPDCRIQSEDGALLYFDTNHLTLTGAEYIRPRLKQVFE